MPKPTHTVANSFTLRLNSLEHTRAKLEDLYATEQVSIRDVQHVYGSLFITAVATFESLIEELFLGLLSNKLLAPPRVHGRISVISDIAARPVVFGGKPYVDWLPYHHTSDRADVFFSGGRPFSNLDDGDRSMIARVVCIRNALAHQSKYAKRKFREEVIGNMPLLPHEKTPTGFLRSAFRANPAQTRYEQLVIDLSTVTRKLCGGAQAK